MVKLRDNIEQNLPFISVINYGENEYVGIVINQDQYVTSFYDLNAIKTPEEKAKFLEIGEIWWWESNRLIPINIFLKHTWSEFRYSIVTLNVKDIKEQQGHVVSLANLANKRTKRRVVQLVRRLT